MSFQDIRDQDTALRLLRNVLRRGRVPNALLFCGPDGVGKRMAAIEMAKAINCRNKEDDSCGECLSCRKAASGNHPDLRIVIPAKKSRQISIEVIEDVTGQAALRPYESQWRVVILQDAERMNLQAQNHFLKTLEEPPGNTLFILLSQFPRMLLPTIRSRCQQVRFRCLRTETIVELLQAQRDLPVELAQAIAGLSQGQMTRALDLVDSDKRAIILSITERLAQGDDPVVISEEFIKKLAEQRKADESSIDAALDVRDRQSMTPEEREQLKEEQMAAVDALHKRNLQEYLYLLETWYRDQLIYAAAGDHGHVLNRDQIGRLEREGSSDPGAKIVAIEKNRRLLERFVSEDRVFRDLFFALAAP